MFRLSLFSYHISTYTGQPIKIVLRLTELYENILNNGINIGLFCVCLNV